MIERIERLAVNFRNAVEKTIEDRDIDYKNYSWFYDFPLGCCGNISELLARYLLENGIKTTYICGSCRNGTFENTQSHAWLIYENDILIDITGDQFRYDPLFLNFNKQVYVGPEINFYRLFEIDDSDCCDYFSMEEWQRVNGQNLISLELYSKIIKHL